MPEVGWVKAKDLNVGTHLQTKTESWLDIDKVDRHNEPTKVYNFKVEGFHTYFVSDIGLLVHNSNCGESPTSPIEGVLLETSTVFRVQGGTPPHASWHHIALDENGNPLINQTTLNISIGNPKHAEYFLSLRPGGEIISFEIPKWMDNFIQSEAIEQFMYKTNPKNQNKQAPKIVDPTTPGRSYELPPIWAKWLEESAIEGSGKIIRGENQND